MLGEKQLGQLVGYYFTNTSRAQRMALQQEFNVTSKRKKEEKNERNKERKKERKKGRKEERRKEGMKEGRNEN